MNLTVFIPYVSPGINKQYGYAKGHTYLTNEARDWKTKAALLIGACAGQYEWKHISPNYKFRVEWWGKKHDEDAHLKIAQDVFCTKLGFNDKIIKESTIKRLDKPPERYKTYWEGMLLILEDIDENS